MNSKAKKCEIRDISVTVCSPNAVLAFLIGVLHVAVLMRSQPLFIAHANRVVIAKIIKKTETDMEIVFSY